MGKFTGKFESAKQDWETPWGFFKPIDAEFHFTLDAAASAANTKVPGSFISESKRRRKGGERSRTRQKSRASPI